MKTIVLLPIQEVDKLLDIKKKYETLVKATNSKPDDQTGGGSSELDRVLEIENRNELETPHVQVTGEPADSVEEHAGKGHPLHKVPKKYWPHARKLVNALQENGEVSWNKDGYISIDGKKVPNAKISKMVKLAVSPRRRSSRFPGEKKFFDKVSSLKLDHLIRSHHVSDKNWYYIGD